MGVRRSNLARHSNRRAHRSASLHSQVVAIVNDAERSANRGGPSDSQSIRHRIRRQNIVGARGYWYPFVHSFYPLLTAIANQAHTGRSQVLDNAPVQLTASAQLRRHSPGPLGKNERPLRRRFSAPATHSHADQRHQSDSTMPHPPVAQEDRLSTTDRKNREGGAKKKGEGKRKMIKTSITRSACARLRQGRER